MLMREKYQYSRPENGQPSLPIWPANCKAGELKQAHAEVYRAVDDLVAGLKALDEIEDKTTIHRKRAELCRIARKSLVSMQPKGDSAEDEVLKDTLNLARLWIGRVESGVGR